MLVLGGLLAASGLHAQVEKPRLRIGFLSSYLALEAPYWRSYFVHLEKHGWREGIDYSLEAREYLGDYRRAMALVRELMELRIDVLIAVSGGAALAAHTVTRTLPVVSWLGYPVEAGVAQSLSRPGRNVTGVASYASAEVWGKFVEFLRELNPRMRELGLLWDYAPPGFPDGQVPLPVIEAVAKQVRVGTQVWLNRSVGDLERALAAIDRSSVDGIIVSAGGGVHAQLVDRIAGTLTRRRLPAISDISNQTVFEKAACTLAYSPNLAEIMERLSHLTDRVLRGAKPAELPFEQPSRFDLVVNAKAARVCGIAIPPSMLARADRVIE